MVGVPKMTKEQPEPPTNSCFKWKARQNTSFYRAFFARHVQETHAGSTVAIFAPKCTDRGFYHLFTLKNSHLQYRKINDLNLKLMRIKKHLLIISSFCASCSSSICSMLVIVLEKARKQHMFNLQLSKHPNPD